MRPLHAKFPLKTDPRPSIATGLYHLTLENLPITLKLPLVWLPDMKENPIPLPKPYLFNLLWDPKEETPRTHLEDSWVLQSTTKVIKDLQQSLAEYPPIPYGTLDPYLPREK